MPNGFCEALLIGADEAGFSEPQRKVSKMGFLQMIFCCQDNSIGTSLSQGYANGHERDIRVWYRERVGDSDVQSDMPGCDAGITRPRKEFTIPALQTSAVSLWFSVDDIRKFCESASQPITVGRTRLMSDMWGTIRSAMYAVLADVDKKGVTAMSTQFGINLATGLNTATVINYDPAKAYVDIIKKIVLDTETNEFCDDFCIVGNGDITALEIERQLATGVNGAGINMQSVYNQIPRIFSDNYTKTGWGANQFGVFERGSVGLINVPRYIGAYNQRIANTEYFPMMLPVNEMVCPQDCLDNFTFDMSIREIDCPTQMTIDGVQVTKDRGYQVVISKKYAYVVKPDLYATGDPLSGVNGTLRYELKDATAPVTP